MKSKFLTYTLPVLLFSVIWGAVEFLVPIRYSEADISVRMVSILFAITSGLSLFLDIPAGKISDRIGRERLITYSMLIAVVALLILYFFSSFVAFFIAAVLVGIAYGLNWSPLLAFVGDRAGEHDQGSVFGSFTSLDALGEVIAPLVLAFIVFYTSTVFPFFALAIAALLCALIFTRLIKPRDKNNQRGITLTQTFSYKSSLRLITKSTSSSLFIFLLGFFVAFFWQSVWFTQPLIGFYENSLMDSAIIVAVFSLPAIIFSKILGKTIDRIGEKRVFFYSISAAVVSFILFYMSSDLISKAAFIFIASIGVIGIRLVMNVLVVKTNTKEERGEFFGILETVRDASFVITPLFIGFTYKAIGLDGIFIVNSVFGLLLLIFGIGNFIGYRIDLRDKA